MDLIEPDEGEIHLFDKRMDRHAVEIKNKNCFYLFRIIFK